MVSTLTGPQASLLLKSVRADGMVYAAGGRLRTATNLVRKGYLTEGASTGYSTGQSGYCHTVAGLEALADYWMRKDAVSGCMAFRLTREEVEAALAEARGQ